MTTSNTQAPQLIRIRDVLARTGLARSTLYAHMQTGNFPRNVKLGAHSSAWVASEVDAWIASRIANRPAQLAA